MDETILSHEEEMRYNGVPCGRSESDCVGCKVSSFFGVIERALS